MAAVCLYEAEHSNALPTEAEEPDLGWPREQRGELRGIGDTQAQWCSAQWTRCRVEARGASWRRVEPV